MGWLHQVSLFPGGGCSYREGGHCKGVNVTPFRGDHVKNVQHFRGHITGGSQLKSVVPEIGQCTCDPEISKTCLAISSNQDVTLGIMYKASTSRWSHMQFRFTYRSNATV